MATSQSPVISNSKLPEIKTYDSEEELLAICSTKIDAQKEEVEEEYEEVTIPERSELQRMTKQLSLAKHKT